MDELTVRGIVVLFCVLLGGCFEQVPTKQPPPLAGVTQVQITVNGNGLHPIATIDDPVRVAAIVAFVNARLSGWETPPFGVPVPTVVAQLHSDGKFVGHFGAGRTFFETDRGCVFCSRRASNEEVRAFIEMLQVDPRYLDINYRPTKGSASPP